MQDSAAKTSQHRFAITKLIFWFLMCLPFWLFPSWKTFFVIRLESLLENANIAIVILHIYLKQFVWERIQIVLLLLSAFSAGTRKKGLPSNVVKVSCSRAILAAKGVERLRQMVWQAALHAPAVAQLSISDIVNLYCVFLSVHQTETGVNWGRYASGKAKYVWHHIRLSFPYHGYAKKSNM